MTVVDVDTHWEIPDLSPEEHPLGPWKDRFPPGLERLAFGIAGDLLRALPDDRRPDGATLLPTLVNLARSKGGPVILHPLHESSATERVAWMDAVGIDHCFVNPGGYWQLLDVVGDDQVAGVARCNDFLAEQLADGAGRLHGVAVVDFADLRVGVAELERVRARGFRKFFLSTTNGRPAGPAPFGHPDWDVVWSAATELGMMASIHVGNTAADFSGWADIGWDQPGGAGVGGLTRLANTQRIHVAQNILVSMLYGGAFHRHPNLTVALEEMRVGWLPSFVAICERQSQPSIGLGEWPFDVSGGEMLRRNVRFTPLVGFGDDDALDVVRALPEMAVFSSDYPHQEGNADPIKLYGQALHDLAPDLRAQFMGGNLVDVYARMGDPL